MRCRAIVALAAGALILGQAVTVVPASASPTPGPDSGTVARYVRDYLGRTGLPGAEVAITKGDQVVLAAGYGHDGSDHPVSADTPMPVASVSKSFTAAAVMQLVEAGRVNLDTPVVRYLPEFTLADPRVSRITVRQLLNQTSGMADTAFPEMHVGYQKSLRDAVALLRTARLAADPGIQFQYHNPNYWVAARLVEVVASEPFTQYLREHVFTPTGMTETYAVHDSTSFTGVAKGYIDAYGQPMPITEPSWPLDGAAGVVTTARDIARWLILQSTTRSVTGQPVVSPASIAQMHTGTDTSRRYGMGWANSAPGAQPITIGHGGSLFTFTASQELLPQSGYGIAVLTNRGPGLLSSLGLGLDDAKALSQGLIDLTIGHTPVAPGHLAELIDLSLAALTVISAALCILALVRSRRWAFRRAHASRWRATLRLLPYLLPWAILAALPSIAVLLTSRDAALWQIAYISPPLVIGLVLIGLLLLGVVAVRSIALFLRSDSARHAPSSPAAEGSSPGVVADA